MAEPPRSSRAASVRVLNLLPDPRWGGPHVRVAHVARRLRQYDIETVVAVPPGTALQHFGEQGLRCVPFSFARARRQRLFATTLQTLGRLVPDALRLSRILRDERCDILHCNGVLTPVGPFGATLAGVRNVWHMNDTLIPPLFYRTMLAGPGLLADRVIYSAHAVARHAGRTCSDEDVMYPPVDLPRFLGVRHASKPKELLSELGLDPERPIVLAVGNVNPVKGHRYLLEAIASLRRMGLSLQAVIVGAKVENRLYEELLQVISRSGLDDAVRFVGKRQDVPRFMALADIYAMPSTSEAMPIALMEAMAAGLPCVVSRVGGVAEAVEHEENGLIVPPRDVEQLADALARYVRDPQLRQRFGDLASKTIAARFSVDRVAAHQARVYRRLLS